MYFSNWYVGKVPKIGKMKVLGTFLIGTLEKYLKIKIDSFRYFFYRYVEKVPKNKKNIKMRKFQVLFQWVRWKST